MQQITSAQLMAELRIDFLTLFPAMLDGFMSESMLGRARDNGILDIDADVIVQKATHKPIVLGKGGAMIKRIAEYAREDLEKMTGSKIYLTLWVRVKEDWRDDTVLLNNLGYDPKKDS